MNTLMFFFILCLVWGVGMLIWLNTPSGKKWLNG